MGQVESAAPVYRLVGLVVKAPASSSLASISAIDVDLFPGRVMPVTYKIGTPVVTLPGAWHHRVSTATG